MAMHFAFLQGSERAMRVAAGSRAIERERHWPICEHGEFTIRKRERCALFGPVRQHAYRLNPVLGSRRHVVASCAPRLDSHATAVPNARVISSAHCNSALHAAAVQHDGTPRLGFISLKPAGDRLYNPLTNDGRREEAA